MKLDFYITGISLKSKEKICKKFLLILFCFLSPVMYSEEKILRFVVMGDPQFGLKEKGNFESTFVWTSSLWEKMPEICKKLNVKYFFVCGDIFALETAGKKWSEVCDEKAPEIFWNEWEKYLKKFDGICNVGWVVGGHEFAYCSKKGETYWNNNSRSYFLTKYPDKVHYTIVDEENIFILFDKTHDWDYLSPGGRENNDSLIWLEKILEQNKNFKNKWIFSHVPPRNITEWWSEKENKNTKFAKLLEKYKITGAFFGHEHDEYFLGDRGGFPMFETAMYYPLLVEIFSDNIKYSWLVDPTNDLRKTIDPFQLPFISLWKIAVVKENTKIQYNDIGNINLNENMDLEEFKEIRSNEEGEVSLKEINLNVKDRIIAVGEFSSLNYRYCNLMIKSKIPFSIWINGNLLEEKGEGDNKYHFYSSYSVKAKEDKNIVVILLEIKDKNNISFSVFRDFNVKVMRKFVNPN